MSQPREIKLGHNDCLEVLHNPLTQNILEKLGYEYSDRGLSEYRKEDPNIVPALVQAVVTELERHPVFPPRYRDVLPQVGVYIDPYWLKSDTQIGSDLVATALRRTTKRT